MPNERRPNWNGNIGFLCVCETHTQFAATHRFDLIWHHADIGMACTECKSKQWAIERISGCVTVQEQGDDGSVVEAAVHIDKTYLPYYAFYHFHYGTSVEFLFIAFASVQWILPGSFSLPFSILNWRTALYLRHRWVSVLWMFGSVLLYILRVK